MHDEAKQPRAGLPEIPPMKKTKNIQKTKLAGFYLHQQDLFSSFFSNPHFCISHSACHDVQQWTHQIMVGRVGIVFREGDVDS